MRLDRPGVDRLLASSEISPMRKLGAWFSHRGSPKLTHGAVTTDTRGVEAVHG